MESLYRNRNTDIVQGLKQVKVDNWGTFLMQRLLQLYFNEDLLDLKIKFHATENVLNVHRLVISTCTDYFLQLENKQNNGLCSTDGIIMPLDMPYEYVKSIISFIYTGQLEYRNSDENVLYHIAQKMNITVLVKLLDTQQEKHTSQTVTIQNIETDLGMQDKQVLNIKETHASTIRVASDERSLRMDKTEDSRLLTDAPNDYSTSHHFEKYYVSNTEGPSRFDIPEIEDMTLGVFSSFDDITYNTKPILQASEDVNEGEAMKKVLTNTLSNKFINVDYQSYLGDQCKRNTSPDASNWLESESTVELEDLKPPSVKKFRCNNSGKENNENTENIINIKPITSVSNHAHIIREVLKKYPHLVERNKNIRLKIMQKESKSLESSSSGKTKISYVVLTSDSLKVDCHDDEVISENLHDLILDGCKSGPWKCTKCNLEEMYTNYSIYRRHMQGVHGIKFDPRICEYCGYKATKRNILIYHMYTKHNIPLPINISFPKCQLCSYVALSELLLSKHQANHKHYSSSLCLQNSISGSIRCAEYNNSCTDVTDSVFPVINSQKQRRNDSDKGNVNCIPVKNLNSYPSYEDNCSKKYRTCFDTSPSRDLSSDNINLSNVPNESTIVITSFDNSNEYQKNQKELTVLPTETETGNYLEVENFRAESRENLTFLKSSENGEYFVKSLTHDDILLRDLKISMVSCSQISKHLNPLETVSREYALESNQDNLNDSKIFEPIKLEETIELDKKQCYSNFSKEKEEIFIKENSCKNQLNSLSDLRESEETLNTEEIIQYIEEETEILEYETSNSA